MKTVEMTKHVDALSNSVEGAVRFCRELTSRVEYEGDGVIVVDSLDEIRGELQTALDSLDELADNLTSIIENGFEEV